MSKGGSDDVVTAEPLKRVVTLALQNYGSVSTAFYQLRDVGVLGYTTLYQTILLE